MVTEEEKKKKKLEQVNVEMARRQELIRLGLREPSKLEAGRAQVLGILPEQIQERKQIREEERQQGILQEQAKQPVEIAKNIPEITAGPPEPPPAFGIPLISEAAQAAELTAQTAEKTNLFRRIRSGEARPDEIRRAIGRFQLDEIDIEVIKAGEADASKTAQFIEGLPFIPREAKRFIPVFKTPTKQVKEILELIEKGQKNIILWSDLAKTNPAAAGQYISLIENKEQEILKLESRIKIMTIQSPDLQSNPEQIDIIEENINNIKGIIQGKRNELIGLGLR